MTGLALMQQGGRRRRRMAVVHAMAGAAVASILLSAPLAAQDLVSRPVVQALPDPASLRLGEALRALAQSPQSPDALIEAGLASLALDDIDAALGFLGRAQALAPNDPRVKAGTAAALARQGQPVPALRLFGEAEQAGAEMAGFAADRGLAFDLVGDNASAQQQYRLALAENQDAAVLRRLAISQAISGDQAASEATLLPMLQRQDLSAYRARAFALAIGGRADEAVSIAETLLPARLSGRMAPYLRFMPRLTPAQQAAAANLGRFPQAAEIGKDDPEIVAMAGTAAAAAPAPARSVDQRLVPSGEPLGNAGAAQRIGHGGKATVTYVPEPPEEVAPAPANQVTQALAQAEAMPAAEPRQASETPATSFSIADQRAGPPVEPTDPVPADTQAAAPAEEVSLAEAFSDFARPAGEVEPAAGSVDISAIEPVREKPKPPPPPPEPSRHWVQVATGRNVSALGFDWRRIKRKAGDLLKDADPYVASWGRTNRLVTGPYPSTKEANAMVRELKAKGLDSFRFTSDEGEKVRKLD